MKVSIHSQVMMLMIFFMQQNKGGLTWQRARMFEDLRPYEETIYRRIFLEKAMSTIILN